MKQQKIVAVVSSGYSVEDMVLNNLLGQGWRVASIVPGGATSASTDPGASGQTGYVQCSIAWLVLLEKGSDEPTGLPPVSNN